MKSGYGCTRWIPVLPELHRALESYLAWLRRRLELTPDMPLFISRESDGEGQLRPLDRESARRIMHAAYAAAAIAPLLFLPRFTETFAIALLLLHTVAEVTSGSKGATCCRIDE
jgi:hypothetical protein